MSWTLSQLRSVHQLIGEPGLLADCSPLGTPACGPSPATPGHSPPGPLQALRLRPSHALQSAALSRPAGHVKDADLCHLPTALSPFTSLAFSCMCDAQGVDGECVSRPRSPGSVHPQACSLWSAPFLTCRLKWDFQPGESSSGARGSVLGSDKEL